MSSHSPNYEEKIINELKKRQMSPTDCAEFLGVSEKYAQNVLSRLAKNGVVDIVGTYKIQGQRRRVVNKCIYGEKKPEMFTRRVHIMQDDDLSPRQPKAVVRVHRDPFDELFFGAAK